MYMPLIPIGSTRQPFLQHGWTAIISSSVPCCCCHFLRITQRSPLLSKSSFFAFQSSRTASHCFAWSSALYDSLRMMPWWRNSLSAAARAFASSYL